MSRLAIAWSWRCCFRRRVFIALPEIFAVMEKFVWGWISRLHSLWLLSDFPKPCGFLRTPKAILTLNLTDFRAVHCPSGTELPPIHQIAHLLYLKIWLEPPYPWYLLWIYTQIKTLPILLTSAGFSALVSKGYHVHIHSDCGQVLSLCNLKHLGKMWAYLLMELLTF